MLDMPLAERGPVSTGSALEACGAVSGVRPLLSGGLLLSSGPFPCPAHGPQ